MHPLNELWPIFHNMVSIDIYKYIYIYISLVWPMTLNLFSCTAHWIWPLTYIPTFARMYFDLRFPVPYLWLYDLWPTFPCAVPLPVWPLTYVPPVPSLCLYDLWPALCCPLPLCVVRCCSRSPSVTAMCSSTSVRFCAISSSMPPPTAWTPSF